VLAESFVDLTGALARLRDADRPGLETIGTPDIAPAPLPIKSRDFH
jgi:hypothetical protein